MCAGPLKTQLVRSETVNQDPVRFEVAVATPGPPAQQRVILIVSRQGLPGDENLKHSLQLPWIFAPSSFAV